jgi:hypothetical protein
MRLYDIACSACGSVYRVAESENAVGSPGLQSCSVCGAVLASWSDRKLKAFRLEVPPELRYPSLSLCHNEGTAPNYPERG